MKLKETMYRVFHGDPDENVVYLILGNEVYFTGILDNPRATSTINAAENVVKAIRTAEPQLDQGTIYYDIQTHRGGYGKKPGEYEVDRLVLHWHENQFSVEEWIPDQLPQEVLECFRHLID